ncbi:hypothetical protein D9J65_13595 [Escherichia coli]|nr:hypothetical protein [Escherichia coli]MHT85793.1 hypothetical protein [Escherichia coli]
MTTITDKKQYPGEQYLNELITNIEFAARAPVEVVRAMAAELQKRREADSAEPVSQTYKFPVNTPCQDAPAHIWLQTAGVWPENGELSELTWCSHNQHHDDTLYVRADLVNGNYPVTPARLPGGFTTEDAKALHEDLVRSHISQALSGEKMKKNDRDADLRWIHGVIVQAAWFVKASLEQNALSGNSPVTPDGLLGCGENCWSCGKYFTYEQHSECDGYCPHCNSPVDLDDEEDQPSKVVPTNPTEEMISNAWREAIGKCDHETIKRIYATMLAAAPQQEVK